MFNSDDFDTLMEALDEWEKSDIGDSLLMGIVGGMFMHDQSESARKAEFENTMNEGKEKARNKKDRSILLKAKLIQLRDKEIAQSAISEMLSQPNG